MTLNPKLVRRTQEAIKMLEGQPTIAPELLQERKEKAADWFRSLRDQICNRFEALEAQAQLTYPELYPAGGQIFERTPWDRPEGGGGEMSVMKGRLFEKVGVNISTVWGSFAPQFATKIPGASEDPRFWASGISLVAHMGNPHVPAVHMNTRFIATTKCWFGGGMDLTPCLPVEKDTIHFHQVLKNMCSQHDPSFYPDQKAWCDDYFYLPHRKEPRGIGGIFYDYLNRGNWDKDFAYTQDVGLAFLDAFCPIVEQNMGHLWTSDEAETLQRKRSRYVEFNLIYDRGTEFGLKTGGNTEAILMSMPPMAKWD